MFHLFNYIIAACYLCIFLLIFTGLLKEKVFGRNALGTATSGIFLTCSLGHFIHATTSHITGELWQAGLQALVDGWTILPAVSYLILRRKLGLLITGPDMIEEYRTQLIQQRAEIKTLREFEQLKDDFLAMASHELRTPLTMISGYAQILEKKVAELKDKKASLAIDTINRQAERMDRLIDRLLDVSQIQSRKLEVNIEPLNMSQFMTDVVERLQITSTDHQLNLQLPDSPVWIKADAARLEQVVNNLVNNAIKYSPNASQVDLIVENYSENMRLRVIDYGSGISAAEIPKIFEHFYRSPSVKNSNKAGLGLGLYICKEIVQAIWGELAVVSEPGQGSTFTVTMPCYSLREVA